MIFERVRRIFQDRQWHRTFSSFAPARENIEQCGGTTTNGNRRLPSRKNGKNSGQTLDLGITQTCGRLLPENTDFTGNIISKETDETTQPSVILAKFQTEIRVVAARLNPTQNTRIQSLTQYHKRLTPIQHRRHMVPLNKQTTDIYNLRRERERPSARL